MMKQVVGFSLPPGELIVKWACRMSRNRSAVQRLSEVAGIDHIRAERLLSDMREVGIALATEHKMQKLLEMENNTAPCLYMDATIKAPIKINVRIGEDIPRDAYEQHKDANGQLYAVGFTEDGEQKISYVEKHLWDDFMRKRGFV